MEYQVSARKYRPGIFDDVVGQTHVVRTLANALQAKRIAHAYLFSGMRGVGKTTVARVLAKGLNCQHGPTATPCNTCQTCLEIGQGISVDVIEIDGASNTGVDDVRELRENVKFSPFRGMYRVYIIDEVHMLSNSAFNALLKTLEEPPAHVVFIFATTEIHKIPATILSRCQHFNFRRIPRLEIIQRLRNVAELNGITVEDQSLAAIARASEGSMRDALSLLDQAVAFGGTSLQHGDLETLLGAVPEELLRDLTQAILAHDGPEALRLISQLLDRGHDLRISCGALVERIRHLLVASLIPREPELQHLIDLPLEDVRALITDTKESTVDHFEELFQIFSRAEDALRTSPHPRFVLEVAAIRATRVGMHDGSSASPPANAPTPAPAFAPSSQAKTLADDRKKPEPRSRTSVSEETQPPAPAPTADSSASPPVGAAPTLDWQAFVERAAASHPNISPFLEAGTLLQIDADHIQIGYPKNASLSASRIQKPENRRILSRLCEEMIGRPMRITVVEISPDHTPRPTIGQTRAAQKEHQERHLFDQAQAHPLVQETLNRFGGEIVDVRQVSMNKEAE